MQAIFYYDRETGEEVSCEEYDRLVQKYGKELADEWVETLMTPPVTLLV